MTPPSKDGCERCGREGCPLLHLGAVPGPPWTEQNMTANAAWQGRHEAALADCRKHALDWRSLYFAALAPPVARVEGTVTAVSRHGFNGETCTATIQIDGDGAEAFERVRSWWKQHVTIEVKQKGAG